MGYETSRPSGNDLPLKRGDVTGAASNIVDTNLEVGKTLISDANGKVSASPITYAELTNISGATSAGTSAVSDNDGFLHNDDGAMKQTKLSKIWDWVKAKINGAASTIVTSNLAVNRALISNSSGKVAVSNVTSAELSKIDGNTTGEDIAITDADRFVMNDQGTMRQVNASSVKNYVGNSVPAGVPRLVAAAKVAYQSNSVELHEYGSYTFTRKSVGKFEISGLPSGGVKILVLQLTSGSRLYTSWIDPNDSTKFGFNVYSNTSSFNTVDSGFHFRVFVVD